jgi:hypothetical protein
MSQSLYPSTISLDKPLDNIIYKVKKLKNDIIDTIYVFYGRKVEGEDILKKIFNDREYDDIKKHNTKIIFSEQRIHPDDSIVTIKIKILNELTKYNISLEEIYLFCKKIETLNSVAIYQSLTQNKKIALTKLRLEQFLQNIDSDSNGNPISSIKYDKDKEVYSYDDIFEMKLDNKEYIINKVLGQKFFIVENEYPFICNPFDVREYDKFLEQNSHKSLSTLNNHLLLNSGEIVDNSIFLCLAEDVLSYVEEKDVSQETTLKIYYPFIYNKNINSLEDLERGREQLIQGNKKIINEKTVNYFKTIDMFYEVFDLRKKDLNYVSKGIKYIKAVMKPDFNVKIPLEIIFKIIHATESNPLIKYNPSSRQENIYRLYTDKIAVDGRKIPYLKKASIFKLMKTIARNKSVSIHIETTDELILNCEFDEEGYITMSGEFNNLVDVSQIDEIFKNSINPIIKEIKSVLEQSGYKLNLFNSLIDENIEIKQMTYETKILITKQFNIDSYKNCINTVFVNETNKLKQGNIILRFKRVSNFSKFTSQEAFILEKAQQGLKGSDIIQALLENFSDDLNLEQARELVSKVANELEVERGVRKTDIKIKENPGFKTIITLDQENAILKISTENINNINYLYTLPIYLDTIIRLTQDKNSTKYPVTEINKICDTEDIEDVSFEDITSTTESSSEEAEIEGDESIEYTKEKIKDAFSLLFDDDDDESSEILESEGGNNYRFNINEVKNDRKGFNVDFEGGQNSSEESITSESDETPKLKYGNVTVPSGLSSDSSQPLEINLPVEVDSSESSVSSLSSLKKESSETKESDKPLVKSSEESVPSEKVTTPVIIQESSETKESDKPLVKSSEESVPSEKVTTPVIIQESSETKESDKPLVKSSEESVPSEKVTTPVIIQESSETKESDKPLVKSSEESVPSEKVTTPVIIQESSETKETDKHFVKSSEESVPSKKEIKPIEPPPLKATPSEESVPSEKVTTPVIIQESSETKETDKHLESFPDVKSSEQSVPSEKVTIPKSSKKTTSTPKDKKSLIIESDKEEDEEQDEEQEEEEKEEDEEQEQEQEEEEIRNIDGMKLNKPYYFQTLIEKKDPILILKEDTKEYNAYSRTCLSDKRRQPVILTDAQLSKINKEHPGFLREQDVIKYGSDEKHQYNYICPRYWCLKSNTFIDPNDIKVINGDKVHQPKKGPSCGKVLPKKEKKVKAGYYIYEFNDDSYPGLIPDKHPNGLCLPCCFKNYNTEARIKAKQRCLEKEKDIQEKKEDKKQEVAKSHEYVLGPEKFPLESGRWGYLPAEIQTILHEINADCQISKTNTNIKENHPCLLRHGIEINKKQSFVAAISDEIFFGKRIIDQENKLTTKVAKVLTIKEMRERILKSINIDSFIKYQNGNLVTDFYDKNKKVDITKYSNSKLYSKINTTKEEDVSYFTKVVSAFENFSLFLKDDDSIIDHTYLWDIICMPNKYLFPNGVNLVIFQIPHDDITNNVQLICPTNHYSAEFYQARKPTIMLIKEDGYYEPIYSYLFDGKKLTVTKEFKERDPQLSKTLRAVFKELIKPFFELICRPLDSMPNIYKAKRPLLLYNLVQKLDEYEYKIIKLVMNFNNKIIGVIAEEPSASERRGFVPCYPSALDENLKKDLDFVFMNDFSIWNNYTDTVQFLNKLDKRSKKRRDEASIPCKPEFKIVEDELVVGILTNTNQFIQISQPISIDEINKDLDLPSITDEDYIVNPKERPMIQSDSKIITEDTVDTEREDYIKKIKLETSFYNVFRNTIRILLNNYENIKIRAKIETEILKEYIIYLDKLNNIDKLLRQLVNKKIQFVGDKNYYKLINEVSTCIVKDKDKCKDTSNLCIVSENGDCNLILPERNLITEKKNEPIYFGRMADELIRYNRIKSFMFQPQTYLSFGNIGYNLRDNEIILIQSILTQEYFENLIPVVDNKYVKAISYDESQPIITQLYENKIPSLDQAIGRKNVLVCDRIDKDHITSGIWRKCFPENYKETGFSKFNFCTFHFIIDLIERKTKEKYEINEIKNQLYDEYKKYLEKYKDKIVDILILEGKKTLGDQVHADTLSFASFIYTDNYFLTTFDLWLLVNKFKIPTIFISQKTILQTKYEKNGQHLYNHEFVGYGDKDDKFAFIVLPGFRPENVPNFKIIKSDKGEVFIPLDKLNENCMENIKNAFKNKSSIEEYLTKFKMPPKTVYEKKKILIIESDDDTSKIDIKKKKKKIIVEQTKPVSSEQYIEKLNKKQTRKLIIKGEPKNKSKRRPDIKKRKLLIVESDSTEKV